MSLSKVESGISVKRQHIGMGPMGTSVFLSARNLGITEFEDLSRDGVAIINRKGASMGSGQFHGLSIYANSDPIALIRHVPTERPFGILKEARKLRRTIESRGEDEFCSANLLALYYQTLGIDLAAYLEDRGNGSIALEANISRIVFNAKKQIFTSIDDSGLERVQSRELVIATGGTEVTHPNLLKYGNKVSLSREWIVENKDRGRERLTGIKDRGNNQIVILGSGNSAASVIGELTSLPESRGFDIIIAY